MRDLMDILNEIPDPEIPVISIVELGMVREAKVTGDKTCEVVMTPTYSACPATFVIETDIIQKLKEEGWDAKVDVRLDPIWSTDWMTDEARRKLMEYGIVPPEKGADENFIGKPKECPRCGSIHTKQISRFGSTLCKATYQCHDCLEPFEYFKCH
ncbi:MAG: 1,2-phenylacetyl-CoA epoxidase subunit PaaD [Weeksellaceae bacterium]